MKKIIVYLISKSYIFYLLANIILLPVFLVITLYEGCEAFANVVWFNLKYSLRDFKADISIKSWEKCRLELEDATKAMEAKQKKHIDEIIRR